MMNTNNDFNPDWSKIGFGYIKTDYNVRCYHRNGKWGEIEISSDENINIKKSANSPKVTANAPA